jgi:hypothetical protein
MILETVSSFGVNTVVISGDFNTSPSSPVIEYVTGKVNSADDFRARDEKTGRELRRIFSPPEMVLYNAYERSPQVE